MFKLKKIRVLYNKKRVIMSDINLMIMNLSWTVYISFRFIEWYKHIRSLPLTYM